VRIKRPGFLEVKKNGFTMTLLLHIPQCSWLCCKARATPIPQPSYLPDLAPVNFFFS
jgi:hypothetical protein